jgi:uncharacterized membrane protein HdeD (DUF308 family)
MNATATDAPDPSSTQAQMEPSARMLMLRGAIAILFAVLAIAWPGMTLLLLVSLFAVYALLGGVVSLASAFRIRRAGGRWWMPLLLGAVSVAAGIAAVIYPAVTALVLVLVIGVNAILTGALDIAIALRQRRVLRGHWLLLVSGIVSVLFGALVVAVPGAGALALVWLISLHAFITGVLLLSLGLRTRRAAHDEALHHAVPAGGR